MKRVYTLYRVSTLGQVEKDDIPMQRKACQIFANAKPDWEITKEFSEKGVSGFKKSAKERDAILEIQHAAVEKKFDVLLVFMFDRIVRRDDETPFVVEWFVQNGIEVWSATEGEQRFDNHVDKLLNYIRYWQAAGESIKTSVRTKTSMGQMVLEGRFKGGVAPYGYRLEKLGRINKKGNEVYDLVVDDAEASVVKLVFHLYVNKGYGPQTISSFLTDEGIKTRKGSNFVCPTIRGMLRNITYTGVLRCGESKSEPFEHLCIVDSDLFDQSQELIRQRKKENNSERNIPRQNSSNTLLSGNIYCGNCGGRLIVSTCGKYYKKKDGTVVKKRRYRYVCYTKTRHKHLCDGQTGYSAREVDTTICEIVKAILLEFKEITMADLISADVDTQSKNLELELQAARKELIKAESDCAAIKTEIMNAIRGNGRFTTDILNEMLDTNRKRHEEAEQKINIILERQQGSEESVTELKTKHRQIIQWADIFEDCDNDTKRMIVSQIIDKIVVDKGCKIDVSFKYDVSEHLGFSHDKAAS